MMLNVGEMMEVTETKREDCIVGEVVIKLMNNNLVSLTDLRSWSKYPCIVGRKLNPGESIALTQE